MEPGGLVMERRTFMREFKLEAVKLIFSSLKTERIARSYMSPVDFERKAVLA